MSGKYVIAWWESLAGQPESITYFKELLFKSSDWDSYGTSPEPTVDRTGLLSEAKVFDTVSEADGYYYRITELIPPKRPVDVSFVMPVSEKEIFNAKLKDE